MLLGLGVNVCYFCQIEFQVDILFVVLLVNVGYDLQVVVCFWCDFGFKCVGGILCSWLYFVWWDCIVMFENVIVVFGFEWLVKLVILMSCDQLFDGDWQLLILKGC